MVQEVAPAHLRGKTDPTLLETCYLFLVCYQMKEEIVQSRVGWAGQCRSLGVSDDECDWQWQEEQPELQGGQQAPFEGGHSGEGWRV